MTEKITVIVPIYNADNYVRNCIESVQAQTYIDWHMILVDDGSKDKSLSICQEYARIDGRISVIHQDNAGVGAARNKALSQARGEYVVFIDSDDFVSPEYFRLLSEHNEDLIFIDVEAVDENGKVIRKEFLSDYRDLSKDEFIRSQMTGKINWGGVRKAVKRSLLNEHNIRYTNTKVGEEALLSFKELYFAKTYSFIEKPVYFYIQRPDSLSHTKLNNPWGEVSRLMKIELKEIGVYDEYANTSNAFIFAAAACSADGLACNYRYKEYRQKVSTLRTQMCEDLNHIYPIDYRNIKKNMCLVGLLLKYKMYNLIWIACILRNKL